ncbi:expressed unknown protein [Seminavis robusta]|uniref:Uncharacterized protein n=1 Tax=Seminavis robusta TaxID=568900 RepID=A0A9N8EVW5_9STRA|nr:expressed unknown protein [Seminavis robusta]|eukprot:Sro1843_g301170.1 n/a (151) ;mRNA; r:9668-10120
MSTAPEEKASNTQKAEVAAETEQEEATEAVKTSPAPSDEKGATNTTNKPTVGEELFLVHLSRDKGEDPDYDHENRKKRSRSIGDELWEVHVKRSKGVPPDFDAEEAKKDTEVVTDAKSKISKPKPRADAKPAGCAEKKVYHLRTRDVLIM